MKKSISFLLAIVLLCCIMPSASADVSAAVRAADSLYELGLFQGTGTDADGKPVYELDRAPTRNEAITMLVRLLGKEAEATSGVWNMPFTDVAAWAKPYVGYAYAHQLTDGTGATTFSGEAKISASQYITFVLRALGYKSGTDFQWDRAWELSDAIGLTDGRYNADSKSFLRGDVTLISFDALSIKPKGSQQTLLETIPVKKPLSSADFTVDPTSAIPAETGVRKLTDSQLAEMKGFTPETAASSISTLADAYAWLAQEGYQTHGMYGGAAVGLANGTNGKTLSWVEMSTVLNVLLQGDYQEVGTLLIVTQPHEAGWDMFYVSFNYVKCGDYYYVTDPIDHLENSGWAIYRAHTIKANSLSVLKDALEAINGSVSDLVTLATYPLFTSRIQVDFHAQPMFVSFPNLPDVNYLFHANQTALDAYLAQQQEAAKAEAERWAAIAKNKKISDYGMPNAIGKTTLDYSGALALVGKDPSLIAEKVKTVGDVLQYMIAARFGYGSPNAYTPWYGSGSDTWGFDAPGDEQLRQNYGCCCGGYANTVSYLLQGDYEKVGTLRWVGGGNHTISWVFTGGKYYVFDFTQYCSMGNYGNYRAPVTVLSRLEDFYAQMPDTYSFFPKSEIAIMVAFEAGAAMYPSSWSDPPAFTGLVFPTEAEDRITVIFQKDPNCGVEYKDVSCSIPGWNS